MTEQQQSGVYKECLQQQQQHKQPILKMDTELKYTFLHGYTSMKQVHEKMLNITEYQKNASQNYNDISPNTSQNGHH